MKTIKINNLNVTDHEGSGDPLIFIHAFPMCSRMWDEQVEFFKNKYRVITYDTRGLGYSNEIDSPFFTMEDLADDLIGIIDELKLENVYACGISLGGYILLRAVLKDQTKFKTIILADTKAEGENNESLIGRYESIKLIRDGNKEEFAEGFIKKVLSEESYNNEDLKNRIREIISWQTPEGMCASVMAIISRMNLTYDLEKIEIPSLIICGEKDILTPTTKAFYMREYIQNTSFKKIMGAGHFTNMEKPDEFNKAVEEFLGKFE
jgi:3-oxoadipate enol-lactonase